MAIPSLSEEHRDTLEVPITIEELCNAVSASANYKALGPDGLATEIYKQYGEILLPELLSVLNEVQP